MNGQKTNQAIRFPYFAWIFAVIWILEIFSFCAYIITLATNIIFSAVSTSDLSIYLIIITITQKMIVCIFCGVFVVFLYERRRTTVYILPFMMFICGEVLGFISALHHNYLLSNYSFVYSNFHYFAEYSSYIIKAICWVILILFIKSALGTKSSSIFQKSLLVYSVPFLYAVAVIFCFLANPFLLSIYNIWSIGHILIAPGLFFTIRWVIHPEPTAQYKATTKKTLDNDAFFKDSLELSRSHSSVIMNVLLLLVTCGLWQYVWVWRITSFTNHAKDEKYRNPLTKLLLYMLVPFYNVYWIYKSANRLDKMGKDRKNFSEISVGCLVLAFFIPLISFILMQDKLNRIADYSASVPMSTPPIPSEAAKAHTNPALDELLQLKQLLDMGAISQDEYDVKKKKILGLDDETS